MNERPGQLLQGLFGGDILTRDIFYILLRVVISDHSTLGPKENVDWMR